MQDVIFSNRQDAGQKLAQKLKLYQGKQAVIFALPRGGVVVAAEVAREFGLPLDLIIARKVGHPYSGEYAVCAVTERNALICNPEETRDINPDWLKFEVNRQKKEAQRQRRLYLKDKQPIPIKDKIAILIDDGVATGLTVEAAIKELKRRFPVEIILAVPVIPFETEQKLKGKVGKIISLAAPVLFKGSVGAYYRYFPQVTDEEVIELVRKAGC